MADYRDLNVWQDAHRLVLKIYQMTQRFPRDEQFGLTSQLRRAAASVPANIAEGNGRGSSKEYLKFLYIARGSLNELRYFVLLARDLQYFSGSAAMELEVQLESVSKLLAGLIRAIQRRAAKTSS
ncbi:MAG: four helix bundle protein [Planctomycetaceae bacterium]